MGHLRYSMVEWSIFNVSVVTARILQACNMALWSRCMTMSHKNQQQALNIELIGIAGAENDKRLFSFERVFLICYHSIFNYCWITENNSHHQDKWLF